MRRLVRSDYHQLTPVAADLQAPLACAVQVRVMTPVAVAFVIVNVLPRLRRGDRRRTRRPRPPSTTTLPGSLASVIDAGPAEPRPASQFA